MRVIGIEEMDKIRATKRSADDYWIQRNCCVQSAYYNKNALGNKKFKVRCGSVWYKGKHLFGKTMNVNTSKAFYYSASHAWNETPDGKIIDWVINDVLGDTTKKLWDKAEVEALGFEYRYYDHEEMIEVKLRKDFKNTDHLVRVCLGEMF